MGATYFSLIVWAHDTKLDYFKDLLESIDDQEYREFELYILDESYSNVLETTIKEFFPDIVGKVHYRKLKNSKGGAYAYNIGSHYSEGTYLVYISQHDRLSPNTLSELNKVIEASDYDEKAIIYSDHDEIIGQDRMYPHFKGGFNKELFLHTDYIGEFICVSKELFKQSGEFKERAKYAYIYEFILRNAYKGAHIYHASGLLYHKRVEQKVVYSKEERKEVTYAYKERMNLAMSYINQNGTKALCTALPGEKKWQVLYDDSEYHRFSKDYIYLHDEKVHFLTRKNAQRMYAYLKQPDVAVVGIRFLGSLFTIDNVGFIHDEQGMSYPAFHGQKIYQKSYEDMATIPRDVSMVDPGCCLIDARVYRGLGGFDPSLSGQDAMLDFCIRARLKGYRTIVIPECIGFYRGKQVQSSEMSHNALMEKHGELLALGDLYYSTILPMGYENFIMPGEESDSTITMQAENAMSDTTK